MLFLKGIYIKFSDLLNAKIEKIYVKENIHQILQSCSDFTIIKSNTISSQVYVT